MLDLITFQIFNQAEILFSIDGERYQASTVHAMIPVDLTRESARNITIKLHGKPAKFIKLRLSFTNKWMLISEISFESGNYRRGLDFCTCVPVYIMEISFMELSRWK